VLVLLGLRRREYEEKVGMEAIEEREREVLWELFGLGGFGWICSVHTTLSSSTRIDDVDSLLSILNFR
jgi:hypothetical protein